MTMDVNNLKKPTDTPVKVLIELIKSGLQWAAQNRAHFEHSRGSPSTYYAMNYVNDHEYSQSENASERF